MYSVTELGLPSPSARAWLSTFFGWPNDEHQHSGLALFHACRGVLWSPAGSALRTPGGARRGVRFPPRALPQRPTTGRSAACQRAYQPSRSHGRHRPQHRGRREHRRLPRGRSESNPECASPRRRRRDTGRELTQPQQFLHRLNVTAVSRALTNSASPPSRVRPGAVMLTRRCSNLPLRSRRGERLRASRGGERPSSRTTAT
jgi:hypothetical protein